MRAPTSFGFTLIELLIVIAIMGIGIALVGPFTIKFVEKAQARDEVIKLERWFERQQFTAFVSNQPVRLVLDGKAITTRLGPLDETENGKGQRMQTEHAFFPQQTITIYENGFVSQPCIELVLNRQSRIIALDERCEAQ